MSRKTILYIAAVVVTATASTGVAEAGEGVRLGFGYPMGSFVATPARGSAVSTAYRAKTALKKQHTLSIANEQLLARNKAKASEEAASVASVGKEPRRVARTELKPAKGIEAAETAEKAAGEKEKEEASTEPARAATGAQALANQDAAESAASAESKAGEDDTAKVAAADAPNEAADGTAGETQANGEETAEVGCKKFIPAIGVTVSVGCDK